MTVRTKLNFCPCCNSKIDAVSSMDDKPEEPRKGDITICVYCTEILEFDEELSLIKIRGETLDSFSQGELDELLAVRNNLLAYNATEDGFNKQKSGISSG